MTFEFLLGHLTKTAPYYDVCCVCLDYILLIQYIYVMYVIYVMCACVYPLYGSSDPVICNVVKNHMYMLIQAIKREGFMSQH